ncbi:MAG: serine/threonine-protein kinase [Myxococcaceae bacterium]
MPLDPTYVGDPLIGQEVGDFKVVEKISQGGMGILYRATDRSGKAVALKVLLPDSADDPKVVMRMMTEVKAARAATHPNIVDVYAVGQLKDGRAYMAMELLRGRPLSEVLRDKGRLGVDEVLQVLVQSTSALEAAHAAGVIHRDLKPGNIFYELRNGKPHLTLLDFGIAKSKSSMNMTAPNAMLGTPGYMAPEQIRGEQITPKTDVYALGVLAYELLAGKGPFEGGSFVAVMNRQLTERAPLLREVVAAAPQQLEELLDQMMAKDPAKRPTPSEVRARLPGANPFEDPDRTRLPVNPFDADERTRMPDNPFGADERTIAQPIEDPASSAPTRANVAALSNPFGGAEATLAGGDRTVEQKRPDFSKVVPWSQEEPMTLPPNSVSVADVSRPRLIDGPDETTEALPDVKTAAGAPIPFRKSGEILATEADLPLVGEPTPAPVRAPPAMLRPMPASNAGTSEVAPLRTSFIRTLSDEPRWKVVLIALVGGAALISAFGWALYALNHHGSSHTDEPSVVELPAPPRYEQIQPKVTKVEPPPEPVEPPKVDPPPKVEPPPKPLPPAPHKLTRGDVEKKLKIVRAKLKRTPVSAAKRKQHEALLDKLQGELSKGKPPAEVAKELERAFPGE